VIAFGEQSVWFANASGLVEWDGNVFTERAKFMVSSPFNGQVREIWGSSRTNIYAVGNNGAIYHYQGSNWAKLFRQTSLPFQDIWGFTNSVTKRTEIIALAAPESFSVGVDLFRIEGDVASRMDTAGLSLSAKSIWFIPGYKYLVAGDGLYSRVAFSSGTSWISEASQPPIYKQKVRGLHCRDVFVVGDFGLVSHFNGNDWHHYDSSELPLPTGSYYGVDITQRLVVIVGRSGNSGLVLTGKRVGN
jgi:hypothetical protein